MIDFTCPRCTYTTTRRSNYHAHLNTTNICKVIKKDISIEDLREKEGLPRERQLYSCPNCNKEYTQNRNMQKHLLKCNVIPAGVIGTSAIHIDTVLEDKDEQTTLHVNKETVHMLLNVINRLQSDKNELNQENKNLNQKVSALSRKNRVPHTVNLTINNTNNFQLNNFGNENVEYMNPDFLMTCFNKGLHGVIEMINMTHFDKDHPENHNIRLRSINNKLVEVMHDNEWIAKDMTTTLNKIIRNSRTRILKSVSPIIQPLVNSNNTNTDVELVTERMRNIYKDDKDSKDFLFNTTKAFLVAKRDKQQTESMSTYSVTDTHSVTDTVTDTNTEYDYDESDCDDTLNYEVAVEQNTVITI